MPIATLQPIPPYNFPALLDIYSRFAHPTLDIVRDGAYWRAFRAGNGLALLRVTGRGAPDAPLLDVDIMAESGDADIPAALAGLRHVLHIDRDRSAFFEMARRDAKLWEIIAPVYGTPGLRTTTPFEALAQVIIEQQIAWVTAQRAQRWLVEWAGNSITHDGVTYFTFPTPQQIAAATVDDLTPLKITFKRMALLINLAQQVVNGDLKLDALHTASAQEAYAYLLALKGIGHWTAAVVVERAFGHMDYVAHNDVALQAAANFYFFGQQGRLGQQTLIDTYAQYGSHAGEAAHYTLYRWIIDRY